MAYTPSQHTVTNKALGIAQATPTDARSYFFQADIFKYRPYQSEAEVLAYLNTDASRTGHFSIIINDGTLDETTGVFTGGVNTEWWFKEGTADANLVIKASGGGGGSEYKAPMWKEADGDMTAGETDFTHASLIGATEMNFIIVNKIIEFINDDYTFDPVTGTIDRSPNQWFAGDKMVTPHKI